MGWVYDYLYDVLRDEVERLLREAGIRKGIDDLSGQIVEDPEAAPKCGAFSMELQLEDNTRGKVIYVVYRAPDLFNPGKWGYTDYEVSVQKVILEDGKIIENDVIEMIDREYRESRARILGEIKQVEEICDLKEPGKAY